MAAKPLTTEAIALTEKKMDMSLDDIIKMSKSNTYKAKAQRVSNRSQQFLNNADQDKLAKIRRFMDARSSRRQGFLAQKRTNFQRNHFPLAAEVARKAVAVPIRRNFNRSDVVNKPRVGAPPIVRKVANNGFVVKPQQQRFKLAPKQSKPQTLDSLFANMKEQRMRVFSQLNAGQQGRQWGGGRFGK